MADYRNRHGKYACGVAVRKGRRRGMCQRTVRRPQDHCYQHKGGKPAASFWR